MVYSASVVRVMIASPSDVADARDAVESALHGWNDARAQSQGVILQPLRWETSAVPVLGAEPQALINSQILDRADIVIGLFGSRLGSPTTAAVSGTVEEIETATASGKPVHLFFSTATLPHDVDTAQLNGLRQFKKEIQGRGLYGEYHNTSELTAEVWKTIEHDLESLDPRAPLQHTASSDPVSFRVQNQRRGDDRYIEITNRSSSTDAENVKVEKEGEWSGRIFPLWGESTTIHAEQTRNIPYAVYLGVSKDPRALRVTWEADGEHYSKVFAID